MAPEQADLQANPDPRWDVYGLGAITYFLLVGQPPLASQEFVDTLGSASGLVERLDRYRAALKQAPQASAHRRIRGVDGSLAAIIDRCLERDPKRRYQTAQEVADALTARARAQRRQKSLTLAVVTPLLLLFVTAVIRWYFNVRTIDDVRYEYQQLASKNNVFAADIAAANASTQLLRLMDALKDEADQPAFLPLFRRAIGNPAATGAGTGETPVPAVDQQFSSEAREQLASYVRERFRQLKRHSAPDRGTPEITSMIVTGPKGAPLAHEYASTNADSPLAVTANYAPDLKTGDPQLLPAFQDDRGPHWLKKISVPILSTEHLEERGAVQLTLNIRDLGSFAASPEKLKDAAEAQRSIVVLADANGRILHHPAFDGPAGEILSQAAREVPFVVPAEQLHEGPTDNFKDPVGEHEAAQDYNHRWVAAVRKVRLPEGIAANSDDAIYVIVQSDYRAIVQPADRLWTNFKLNTGVVSLVALLAITGLVIGLLRYESTPTFDRPR
jgi:hypothetical protein